MPSNIKINVTDRLQRGNRKTKCTRLCLGMYILLSAVTPSAIPLIDLFLFYNMNSKYTQARAMDILSSTYKLPRSITNARTVPFTFAPTSKNVRPR